MQSLEAYVQIKSLKRPIITTRELSALFNIRIAAASKMLTRLAKSGLLIHLKSNLWGMSELLTEELALPQYLVAPFPSYISLQSALYYHGIISQIPEIIYAVSLARTKEIITALGTVSIHHIKPEFFFGFITITKHNIKIATAEKALLDIAYLSIAKSGLFASLPELELPKTFDINKILVMLQKISSKNRRTVVTNYLSKIFPYVKMNHLHKQIG